MVEIDFFITKDVCFLYGGVKYIITGIVETMEKVKALQLVF